MANTTVVTNSKITWVKNQIDQLAYNPNGNFAGNVQFTKTRSIVALAGNQANVVHDFKASSANQSVGERKEMKLAQNSIFVIMGVSLGFQIEGSSIIYYNEKLPNATDAEKESLALIQASLLNLKAGTEKEIYRNFQLESTRQDENTQTDNNEYAKQIVYNPHYWCVSGENNLTGTMIPDGIAATPTANGVAVRCVLDLWGFEIEDMAKALYFKKAKRLPEFISDVMTAWYPPAN